MKTIIKDKQVYLVFWIVFLLSHTLFVHDIWARLYGSSYIAYTSRRTGNSDIYLIHTNGKNPLNLTNHPTSDIDPTWSPDGRFLAYSSKQDGTYKIYVMDISTREQWRLTNRHEEEWAPAWAPDGKWIAFVSGSLDGILWGGITSHIYKVEVNGANLVKLTDHGKNLRPAWSPDSQQIAFVSYHRGNDRKGLYVMDADGRGVRRLDDKSVQALDGIFQSECAWSPDGKQIAFSIALPRNDRMHLCVIDIDGENFRQLTQGGPILEREDIVNFPFPQIHQPAWSPDGQWIAYAFAEAFGTADIYVIDAMGGTRGKPLVKEIGWDQSPAWAPETFFSVSPSAEKQTILWGRLKQAAD